MELIGYTKSCSRASCAVWTLAFAVCSALSGADWPTFRGPRGDGHASEAKLPVQWSNTENVMWKQAIPGEGWSSPVIVGNRVYLTAAVPQTEGGAKDFSLRLLCLDAGQGTILFDSEVFQEIEKASSPIHSKNSHASPTPLVVGDRIYVHFGHEGTACLDKNGKLIWENRRLRYAPVHGAGATPILVDGALIFSCDGQSNPFVVALDANTGKELWKKPRASEEVKKFSFATATVISVGGKSQVISPGSGVVNSFDPATGDEIWHARYDGYSVIPKPVFGNGLVYVCTGYNNPTLIAIRPDGQGDVTDTHVAWTVTKGVPHTSSLLLIDNMLFMASDAGIATCLDATTGEQIWQNRLGGNFSASPLLANGLIYFQSEEGETTVIRASREYEVVAKNSIGERTLASLSAAANSLFLRTDKNLYRIAAK